MLDNSKKTSQIIAEIVDSCVEESTITVSEFLGKMGQRALAIAILVFSISAAVGGVIPGFSTITAIPIIFIAIQMSLGQRAVRLPDSIRNKHISPKIVSGALRQSIPVLSRLEKLLRPRILWLTNEWSQRAIALIIILLAGVLALPIPGGNFLPSIMISLMALAILERDGVLLLLSFGILAFTGGLMLELITQAWLYTMDFVDVIF